MKRKEKVQKENLNRAGMLYDALDELASLHHCLNYRFDQTEKECYDMVFPMDLNKADTVVDAFINCKRVIESIEEDCLYTLQIVMEVDADECFYGIKILRS